LDTPSDDASERRHCPILDFGNPIRFYPKTGRRILEGYDSERFLNACKLILKATRFRLLKTSIEAGYAAAAESLIVSLANVGLVALISASGRSASRSDVRSLRETIPCIYGPGQVRSPEIPGGRKHVSVGKTRLDCAPRSGLRHAAATRTHPRLKHSQVALADFIERGLDVRQQRCMVDFFACRCHFEVSLGGGSQRCYDGSRCCRFRQANGWR